MVRTSANGERPDPRTKKRARTGRTRGTGQPSGAAGRTGRPRKDDAVRRWPAVNVNLPPAVLAHYRDRAAVAEKSLMEVVRDVLVREAGEAA